MLLNTCAAQRASSWRPKLRLVLALSILLELAAALGNPALARTRRGPASVPPDTSTVLRIVPGFVIRQPEAMARIGQRCRVHPHERLWADTVLVHHSITGGLPGDMGPVRDSFPNANVLTSGSCVDLQEREEVVFCRECRRALARWLNRPFRHTTASKDSLRSTRQ